MSSEINPSKPSDPAPIFTPKLEEIDAASQVAEEILSQEGNCASKELREMVERFRSLGNAVHLNYLRAYLNHFHQLEGGEEIANALWKTIRVNEQGGSILHGIISPVMQKINPQTVPYLKILAKEPDLLFLWIKFVFAMPPQLHLKEVSPELLRCFLSSPLGKGHQTAFHSSRETALNIQMDPTYVIFVPINDGVKMGFHYIEGLSHLFADEELLGLCSQFSVKHACSSQSLIQWAQREPELLKTLLQHASRDSPGVEEREELLASLTGTTELSLFGDLFNHPQFTPEKTRALTESIREHPLHANLQAALLLYQFEHPGLENPSAHANASCWDFMNSFYVHQTLCFDGTSIYETICGLSNQYGPQLDECWIRLSKYPPAFNNRLISRFQEINSKDSALFQRIITGKYDVVFLSIACGLLTNDALDLAQLQLVLDWVDDHPGDYRDLQYVISQYSISELLEDRIIDLHQLVRLAIQYTPEKIRSAIDSSYGVDIGFYIYIAYELFSHPAAARILTQKLLDNLEHHLENAQQSDRKSVENHQRYSGLFQRGSDFHRLIRQNSTLTEEDRRQFIVVDLWSLRSLSSRSLYHYYQVNPLIGKKLLQLAAVHYEFALSNHVLARLRSSSSSPISTLYQRALLSDNIAVVKALAKLEAIQPRIEFRRQCQRWASLSDEQAFNEIISFNRIVREGEDTKASSEADLSIRELVEKIVRETPAFSITSEVRHKIITTSFTDAIASKLVSKDGKILIGNIPQLLNDLSQPLPLTDSYIRQIRRVLLELQNNPRLLEKLENLHPLTLYDDSADLVIKASSGLPYHGLLTTEALRRTALASLVLHIRQPSQVGSCVGSSQLNALLSNPERALGLIGDILTKGEISIEYDHRVYGIRFSPRPNRVVLEDKFVINSKCELVGYEGNPSLTIAALPGVVKLAQFLDLTPDEYVQWLQDAMSSPELNRQPCGLDKNREPLIDISHSSLIKALVASAQNKKPAFADIGNLLEICETVYLSTIENLTSRILEGLLVNADIAEKVHLQQAFAAIFRLIPLPIQSEQPLSLKRTDHILMRQTQKGEECPCAFPVSLLKAFTEGTQTQPLWNRFIYILEKTFNRMSDVVYDPNAKSEKDSSYGSRVLLDRTANHSGIPEKVDTPAKIQQLCCKVVDEAIKEMEGVLPGTMSPWWQKVSEELKSYMEGRKFLNAFTLLFSGISYDLSPSERTDESVLLRFNPLEHLKDYQRLPWRFMTGGITGNAIILMSALEKNEEWRMIRGVCKSPEELKKYLLKLINFFDFSQAKHQCLQGEIPGHAVNFIFTHPALQPLIEADNPSEWLLRNCEIPSRELSKVLKISRQSYQEICHKINLSMPELLRPRWNELTETTEYDGSLASVREELLKKLSLCLGTTDTSQSSLFALLENALFGEIPEGYRSQLKFLPLIDSNWSCTEDNTDIYLALLFNPVSLQWELCKTDAEFKKVEILDRASFFTPDDYFNVFFIV